MVYYKCWRRDKLENAKKILKNLFLFILLMTITFYVLLKDQDITALITSILSVKKEYLIVGVVCMLVYFSCEAVNIGRTLKALGEKNYFLKNLKYALIGFFFSSITPAASGGQPMQVYFMHKDKIMVANSTLALLINLTCMQIVTISIALISLSFNYGYMNAGLFTFFAIGILLNISALALLFIALFSKKLLDKLICFCVKILRFFKVKNVEAKQEKLEAEIAKYRESAVYVKNHREILFKNLITAYVQFFVYYSISYWVYRSFGLSGYNLIQITTMQSVVFATVSGIPSPGAVGVSEAVFLAIFRAVFPEETISSAMLINRGISFYLFVAFSAIVVMIATLAKKEKGKIDELKSGLNVEEVDPSVIYEIEEDSTEER